MSEPFTVRENDSGTAGFGAFEGLATPESSAASSECDAQEQEEEWLEELESPELDELVEAIDRAQVAPSDASWKANNMDENTKETPLKTNLQAHCSSHPSTVNIMTSNSDKTSSVKNPSTTSHAISMTPNENQASTTQSITVSATRREDPFTANWNNTSNEVDKRTNSGGGFDYSTNSQSDSCRCCDHNSSVNNGISHERSDPFSGRSYDRNTDFFLDEEYDLLSYRNQLYNENYYRRMDREIPRVGERRYNRSRFLSESSNDSTEEESDSSSSSASSQGARTSSKKNQDSSRRAVCEYECSACKRKYGSLADLEKHQDADGDWNLFEGRLVWAGGPCYRANPKNKPNCAIQ